MESVEILKISKSLPQEIFDNIGIPICYTVNKQDYYKLPNYLDTIDHVPFFFSYFLGWVLLRVIHLLVPIL